MTLTVLSATGCAASDKYRHRPSGAHYPVSSYVRDVPFFPQEEFQCGPSVLAGVLNFRGYAVDNQEISEAIYSENIKGTLKMDMVRFVNRYVDNGGLLVSEESGDIGLLREDIADGNPAVVFVDIGFWIIRKGHYMLIVGYDDARGGVIAYSGRERDKFISYRRFLRMWERGGYWTLRVIPAGQGSQEK